MTYRRRGREQWLVDLRTQTGWKKGVSTRTTSKALAGRMELMWETLATEHRAWEILGHVLAGALTIGQLYDLWVETRYNVAEIRRRLSDQDLEQLVEPFLEVYAGDVAPDSLEHMRAHLRWLLPEGVRLPASHATPAFLTEKLAAYGKARNTRRKVHSNWSVFFDFATRIRGAYLASPMLSVDRPKRVTRPIRFYELDIVDRIVGWQPTAERRALFALLYGTGVELSTAKERMRADVWPDTKELRAPGTKAHTRDRVVRFDEWAWPIFWGYAKDLLPTARLFPFWHRRTVHRWHQEVTGSGERRWKRVDGKDVRGAGELVRAGLELPEALPVHNARHSWAVRNLRAGVPVAVVQRQLGHATAKETLDTYGAFAPSGEDRGAWAAHVAAADERRRKAQ